jgi:hypothetical protein
MLLLNYEVTHFELRGYMKKLVTVLTLTLLLLALSCGSGHSNSNNVTGSWTATLVDNKGSPSFAFSTMLFQNSDNSVSATNLNFSTATPCFTQGSTTASGGFTLGGNFNGAVTGKLALVVQSKSGSTVNNALTLNGTVNKNTVTGTWTLTGSTSGCTGSGNFTMQR